MNELLLERQITEKIRDLTAIRHQKAELSRKETELSIPIIEDTTMVGNIFDVLLFYNKGNMDIMYRKKCLFVIIYLFSPNSLGGSRIRRGIRDKIAVIFDCTCSNISHDYRNVAFYFQTYKSFRKDVCKMIVRLLEDLKEKERR
jgi:hypothetical protein